MNGSDRSIGTVLSAIVGDLQQIVRAEVRLARAEVRDEVGKAKRGAVLLLCGGVVLAASLGLILLSAVYALAIVWPLWAAALAIAASAALAGLALARAGRQRLAATELLPERTTATVKENFQWAKSRTK